MSAPPPLSLEAVRRRLAAMWPLGKIVADLAAAGADSRLIANAVRDALANPPAAKPHSTELPALPAVVRAL